MLLLLIAALTLPAPQPEPASQPPAAAPRAPDTDRTVPATKGARLRLNNMSGEIVVRGWDRDEVRVQARHAPRTTVQVRSTAAAVSIEASAERGVPGAVDYEIAVPRWMPLRLEGMNSYVQVDDVQADVHAEAFQGDVVIRGVQGNVKASSFNGEATIERVSGRVEASSVNRVLTLTNVTGDILAESVSGGVRLSGIRSRSVDVSTISGGVTYAGEIVPDGTYRLMSHSGGITLTTPALDATITVRSYSGRFESAFETTVTGAPRRGQAATHVAGQGRARVDLETFSGGIRIRRTEK